MSDPEVLARRIDDHEPREVALRLASRSAYVRPARKYESLTSVFMPPELSSSSRLPPIIGGKSPGRSSTARTRKLNTRKISSRRRGPTPPYASDMLPGPEQIPSSVLSPPESPGQTGVRAEFWDNLSSTATRSPRAPIASDVQDRPVHRSPIHPEVAQLPAGSRGPLQRDDHRALQRLPTGCRCRASVPAGCSSMAERLRRSPARRRRRRTVRPAGAEAGESYNFPAGVRRDHRRSGSRSSTPARSVSAGSRPRARSRRRAGAVELAERLRRRRSRRRPL